MGVGCGSLPGMEYVVGLLAVIALAQAALLFWACSVIARVEGEVSELSERLDSLTEWARRRGTWAAGVVSNFAVRLSALESEEVGNTPGKYN